VPTSTTNAALLNQACTYLGGPYDASRRWYSTGTVTPVLPYVYVVKRAYGKDFNARDFTFGATLDSQPIGAYCAVVLGDNGAHEERIAMAGQSGIKKVSTDMELRFYVRANTQHAEDCEDAMVSIVDSTLALLRADKTMGSGGFEAGGFQIAETSPWLIWRKSKVVNHAGLSKGYVHFSTEAHFYVFA